MEAVSLCLTLLALTCAASLLTRVLPLPLPFLQIAAGVVAALPPISLHVALEPDAFLLLFIPLLLFGDGLHMPQRALHALRWPVLGHAVGLVLLTILIGGYGLHWLIPSLPLSVAFAVAALVSPTDPVAVSAITERIHVPQRMMHLLTSEALLNDATGLVAMRFAVAATLSGRFSLGTAAASFVIVALGGLAIGWVLTLVYAWLHSRLLVRAQDAAVQTVLSALLPFAAYGLAEAVHVSGILAAVAAGIAASRVRLLDQAHFSARLQAGGSWKVVGFCLNGVIFVMLGLQLPGIIGSGPEGIDLVASDTRWVVLGEVAALAALLVAVRLAWVLASVGLERLAGSLDHWPGWRVVVASSLAGVRGAVTLAGVLSLPLLMPSGMPFPGRDLAITLATGVILASMVLAALLLPPLLRRLPPDGSAEREEVTMARIAAAEAGLQAVTDGAAGARGAALVTMYTERLAALRAENGDGDSEVQWRRVHRRALGAERAAIQRLREADTIDDTVARHLLGEIDLFEAALSQKPHVVASHG